MSDQDQVQDYKGPGNGVKRPDEQKKKVGISEKPKPEKKKRIAIKAHAGTNVELDLIIPVEMLQVEKTFMRYILENLAMSLLFAALDEDTAYHILYMSKDMRDFIGTIWADAEAQDAVSEQQEPKDDIKTGGTD